MTGSSPLTQNRRNVSKFVCSIVRDQGYVWRVTFQIFILQVARRHSREQPPVPPRFEALALFKTAPIRTEMASYAAAQ